MRVVRKPVSKRHSASKFRRNVGHTKQVNLRGAPQRGGWRL